MYIDYQERGCAPRAPAPFAHPIPVACGPSIALLFIRRYKRHAFPLRPFAHHSCREGGVNTTPQVITQNARRAVHTRNVGDLHVNIKNDAGAPKTA